MDKFFLPLFVHLLITGLVWFFVSHFTGTHEMWLLHENSLKLNSASHIKDYCWLWTHFSSKKYDENVHGFKNM